VTAPSKRKGDDAERQAVELLASLGIGAYRLFGPARPTTSATS
jgi:hypothetical protein